MNRIRKEFACTITFSNNSQRPRTAVFDSKSVASEFFTDDQLQYVRRTGPLGATLGCNWQAAPLLLVGLEGDADTCGRTPPLSTLSVTSTERTQSLTPELVFSDFSGRAGTVLWEKLLIYLKGGVGLTQIKSTLTATLVATGSSTRPFWIAGAGIEYAVTHDCTKISLYADQGEARLPVQRFVDELTLKGFIRQERG